MVIKRAGLIVFGTWLDSYAVFRHDKDSEREDSSLANRVDRIEALNDAFDYLKAL